MKRILFLLMLIPVFGLCQLPKLGDNMKTTKVEVVQSRSQISNEKKQADAAQTSAAANMRIARAAEEMAKAEPNFEIKVPLEVDLNNYTHLALIGIGINYAQSIPSGKQWSRKMDYKLFEKNLYDSPLTLLNPYTVDVKKAKEDKRFLRETKDSKWLYLYYNESKEGINNIKKVIVRDSNNKIIYNLTTTNVARLQTLEALIYF
jgi:hypothetical protein